MIYKNFYLSCSVYTGGPLFFAMSSTMKMMMMMTNFKFINITYHHCGRQPPDSHLMPSPSEIIVNVIMQLQEVSKMGARI